MTTATIPVADARSHLPSGVRISGPAVGTSRPAPSYKPATEDVLLAIRIVEHPMLAASVLNAMREALSRIAEPALSVEDFALRATALGAAEALAIDDQAAAQRLLAWCRH